MNKYLMILIGGGLCLGTEARTFLTDALVREKVALEQGEALTVADGVTVILQGPVVAKGPKAFPLLKKGGGSVVLMEGCSGFCGAEIAAGKVICVKEGDAYRFAPGIVTVRKGAAVVYAGEQCFQNATVFQLDRGGTLFLNGHRDVIGAVTGEGMIRGGGRLEMTLRTDGADTEQFRFTGTCDPFTQLRIAPGKGAFPNARFITTGDNYSWISTTTNGVGQSAFQLIVPQETWTRLTETSLDGIAYQAGVWTKKGTPQGLHAALTVKKLGGSSYELVSTIRNMGSSSVTCKFMTEAVTDFIPNRYLFPGIIYNGNAYGSHLVPKGLTCEGLPWIFSYDRSTLPSCTVSENAEEVFATFASDCDARSLESSSSLVKRGDGRFAHRIYYPVTEAPISYTNKKIMSRRYDTWLTIRPGENLTFKSYAVRGKTMWPNFGYATVFHEAWPLLDHTVPRAMSDEELWYNGMQFVYALRTKDAKGRAGVGSSIQDASHALGNFQVKKEIPPELTLEAICKDLRKNFFLGGPLPTPDRIRAGGCSGIGFTGQCFMSARMMIADGYRHKRPESIAFGRDILDNWLENFQLENGLLIRPFEGQTDCCHQGWGIIELVRVSELLKEHGAADYGKYAQAAEKCARFFIDRWDGKFGFGAAWKKDGTPNGSGGDVGGFVLFGISKLWQWTKNPIYRDAAIRGLRFYFDRDVNRYACGGGAIDCQSVDKESSYPFLESSLVLYETTKDPFYLACAKKAAYYFCSWIYCFNARYPPEAEFSQIGYHTAGGTIVGVEHQCIDPYGGVVVAAFKKLGAWTGEKHWAEVGELVWLNSIQAIATEKKRMWHGMVRPVGAQNEAFCQTRWSKYRVDPNQRGNYNDFISVWMLDFKMASLLEMWKYGVR